MSAGPESSSTDEELGSAQANAAEATDTTGENGPPVEISHQAKLAVGDDSDDEEDVLSTAGVCTDTTLDDWGVEVETARATPDTRLDRPEASEFGVDDRPEVDQGDSGEQVPLLPDVSEDQQTLDGEAATGQFLFDQDRKEADAGDRPEHAGSQQATVEDISDAAEHGATAAAPAESEHETDAQTAPADDACSCADAADSGGNSEDDSDDATDPDGGDDSGSEIYGLGAGRRRTLQAIEEQPRLEDIEELAELSDLVEAIRDLGLDSYRNPPTDTIDVLESIHGRLPDEAQSHFVDDDILRRRINAARHAYNEFLRKLKREKEMPSPVEAGPANYPAEKARKRSEQAQKGREELDHRIDKIEAGARGARQRALEAIGSSVAEQNQQAADERRARRREQLSAGDLVQFRNPILRVGEVVRVNEKSIRVRYPNPRAGSTKPLSDEPEPDYCEERVDLDQDFLTPLTDENIVDVDLEASTVEEARDELFDDD